MSHVKQPAASAPPAEDADAVSAAAPRSSPEEVALVHRLLAGDEAAFSTLVDRHHGALLRLAALFVSSRAVAEEVVQETWVAVLDGLHAFEGRSSLKTWIFRILTNRAKTRGIREGRTVPFSALHDAEGVAEPAVAPARFRSDGAWAAPPHRWDDDTPEALLMRKEALLSLSQALAELPASQRTVVMLRDVEGFESEEVCSILGIRETNQRVLLHRARSRLRRALEEHLGE